MNSLKHALSHLLRFDGRDTRTQFWTYAAFVLGFVFLVSAAGAIPVMADFFARMQKFAAEHPELATVTEGPGSYSIQIEGAHPELMFDVTAFLLPMWLAIGAAVLLLAAAVTRRLRDGGKAGWWGLGPLPFLAFAAILTPRLFADVYNPAGPDLTLFMLLFANNILYFVALVVLVVMLCAPTRTSPGPSAR